MRDNLHRMLASGLVVVFALTGAPAGAAKLPKSVDMTGAWVINDTLTAEARESLPEPKKRSGFFSRLTKRVRVSVQVPGTGTSVPMPGGDGGEDADDSAGASMHDYGRVAELWIRQRPDQFAIDYGFRRVSLYTPDATTTEKLDKRKIRITSGWRGDRYVIRKTADDGSKLSEEFELINDGAQLKWTVVDFPKEGFEVTDVAIYDRAGE